MNLLLVEDDLDLGRSLLKLLQQHYRVEWVRTLAALRAHGESGGYDLVILDLGLPDGDGNAWLDDMRAAGDQQPVLILSARDALDARVAGLDRGADDYLVKPFEPTELLARIRALLRRGAGQATPHLVVGDLSLRPDERRFFLAGQALDLTPNEYRILSVLIHAGTRPVSRERLLDQLYGTGSVRESNTLEVHVHALRRILGKRAITTERGFGYRLSLP